MFDYCIIMAAGKGTRMNDLTANCPKALVRVNNIPLISYTLDQISGKISFIAMTVSQTSDELIKLAFEDNVNAVFNTSNKENAWWIFNTVFKDINKPVLVLPCDNLTKINLQLLFFNYMKLGCPSCMLVPVQINKEIEGDYIRINESRILSIGRDIESDVYSSGIQVLNPFKINKLCGGLINMDFLSVWDKLIEHSSLFCSDLHQYPWYSVNNVAQVKNAEILLRNESIDLLSYKI